LTSTKDILPIRTKCLETFKKPNGRSGVGVQNSGETVVTQRERLSPLPVGSVELDIYSVHLDTFLKHVSSTKAIISNSHFNSGP
jgi:hypothetical protein